MKKIMEGYEMKRYIFLVLWFCVVSVTALPLVVLTGCGGGGGGDSAPAPTPVPPTPPPSTEALIGNFRFVYKILTTWTDRITLNTKSSLKSSEGTDVFTGFNASYPSVTVAVGSWMPSISKYIIVEGMGSSSPFVSGYVFSINADNTLPGCYMISSDSGDTWSNCYAFILPNSHKTPLGSWEMTAEAQASPIDIIEAFEKRLAEDREIQARHPESAVSVDGDLKLKINELKALISGQ